jgi:hypothetical protein
MFYIHIRVQNIFACHLHWRLRLESQPEAPVPVVSPGRNPDPSTVPRARTKSLLHSTLATPKPPPSSSSSRSASFPSGLRRCRRRSGRGVPRVPRRGVADAREAAPGGARVPLGRGRVLGQHTRRIRGECFPVVDDGFLVLGRLGGHRFSGNRWIVGFVF